MTTTYDLPEHDRPAVTITDYDQDLVPILRPLREANGKTGRGLARELHVTESLIPQREFGGRTLTMPAALDTLSRLRVRVVLEAEDDAPQAVKDLLAKLAAA